MELSSTEFGPFNLYAIETGRFRLDGGAMFGVVPKTLWSRRISPDEKNRIPMAMRCLLIESKKSGKIYLVDDGVGTKFNQKMADIYQVDHNHSNLADSLQTHGFSPEDITDLIFTHLHFDHCGGTTFYDENGEVRHFFKNARYHITKKHWQTATQPNVREAASFLEDNIQPLAASNRLHLVDENHQFEEGLSAISVNGHTLGQQLPKIEATGKTIVFMADLIPTKHHVFLPWVMGYDMFPTQTLDEKEAFLTEASEKNWYLFMEHDAESEIIIISKENGKFQPVQTLTLSNL